MENVPYEGGSKPLFGRAVIREVFHPPLFSNPPPMASSDLLDDKITRACDTFLKDTSRVRDVPSPRSEAVAGGPPTHPPPLTIFLSGGGEMSGRELQPVCCGFCHGIVFLKPGWLASD